MTFPSPPVTGERESQFGTELTLYTRSHGGKALSSNTGFLLPDTSVRTCSASHVSAEQLGRFSKEELDHFAPIVPEFVVEVRCPTDSLPTIKGRMREVWLANGVKLAWLIDVDADKLWIYRADGSIELVSPLDKELTGEDVLPGFTFDLSLLT